MKKLVYILSLAIGLLMTGCAQWETMESLPRDTWGPEPELTIEIAPLDSITGALISDKMDVVFYIKNATNLHFVYDEGPEQSIDYTALLKGQYGGWSAEPALEGDTLGIQLPVEAGKTYTVYAVVANAAGVQTTAVKTVGAVDVTAPVITTVSPLAATNAGKQVTLAFDENIIRTDAMPAITYEVLDENLESYATGDATAMASGKNLVVTLPATFEFNAEGISIVLLSFGEGSVEDKYGNKMAAIANALDEDGLPNGPWWMYDPNDKPVVEDGFLKDGGQYFYYGTSTSISQDGKEQEVGTDFITLSLTQAGVDMSQIFNGATTGDLWSIPSIFNMFTPESGIESVSVPAYSYDYEQNTYFTMVNTQDKQWLTPCGSVPNVGTCYLGDVTDDGNLYPYWDFVLLEQQGQEMLQYAGNRPVIFFFQEDGTPALILDFTSLYIFDEGALGASVTYYETPVVLENAKLVKPQDIKKFNFVEKY